jgi:hypothetical protein
MQNMWEELFFMNEFTKEELKYLFKLLYDWNNLEDDELQDKIQSMIDNYCDHEPLHNFSRSECKHCDKNLCYECGSQI